MNEAQERFSILQAINKNNQLIGNLIDIEEKLIREVNITAKAANLTEKYINGKKAKKIR